ncbi:hypothetical protein ACFX13_040994 [Malus domestica]
MASIPGILTEWPWKPLGNLKYLILAPWVIHSTLLFIVNDGKYRDSTYLLMFPLMLWRMIHNQIWITRSRYRTTKGNGRIVDKGLEFDQLLAAIELALLGPSPLSSSQRMELVHAICSSLFSVHNPDRAAFSHYDNTLQLIYSSSQVRFMFIPAGKIEAGQTQFMASTFAAQLFPVFDHNRASEMVQNSLGPTFGDGLSGLSGTDAGPVGSTMQIESRLEKGGWIRVVHFLTHHVETKSRCEVYIAVSDGSALAFHC